jgi:hypothetical protein
MKRDLDLIREILLKIEQDIGLSNKRYSFQFDNQKMVIDGYNDEQVYGHIVMLIESPFVEGLRYQSGEIEIKGLTWDGREFLDAIRDAGGWKKTKETAQKIGGAGLSFVWDVAKALLKAEAKSRLGLDV